MDIKSALYKYGFSEKQIFVIERAMKKSGMMMEEVLHDLSVRFIKTVCVFLMFIVIVIVDFFYYDHSDIMPFIIIFLVLAGVFRFFVPFRLSAKSLIFLMKHKKKKL
ncbi:hypothetical protein ACGVWS_00280 [Enterobacteriaceae bacterium LUAb1]